MTGGDDVGIVLSRTIAGGIVGAVRSSCTVHDDGTCVMVEGNGDPRTERLDQGRMDLVRSMCAVSGFSDLPEFVDAPVTRSDAYTWTYEMGGHRVRMRDVDRAGDAVPAPLHVADAIVAALAGGGS